jgi:hypothetical protein
MELGVFKGESLRFIAENCGTVAHGFDSFEGLPEGWRPEFPAGAFATTPPPSIPSGAELHVGLFSETLPSFLAGHPGPIRFLHIDCDIYRSTRTALELCSSRIERGTVLVFDEYIGYPGWREHEHKAFSEFLARTGRGCEVLGAVERGEQVAFVITS